MIEAMFLWWLESKHPPAGTTLKLSRHAGDLRNDEQMGRWSSAVMRAAWRARKGAPFVGSPKLAFAKAWR